ncbi:MAG: hypothetical protein IJR45_00270 [Firmicutes bacterium]|nr:hypothetical protein [Bacillota bacterium]MBQ9603825.1 hypothetical protein [Bacillota bacterium]
MKLKLENRIDDDVMKHITGGTLEVSHETSADEMEHFAAARANCPICGGTKFDYKFFVMGDNAHCRMGQKCLNEGCGYSWTFGPNLDYEA